MWATSVTAQATVDEMDLTGDERGIVRGKERNEVGDVLGSLLSLQVLHLDVACEGLLGKFTQGRGSANHARGQRVDRDVVLGEVGRQRVREPVDCALSGDVGDEP